MKFTRKKDGDRKAGTIFFGLLWNACALSHRFPQIYATRTFCSNSVRLLRTLSLPDYIQERLGICTENDRMAYRTRRLGLVRLREFGAPLLATKRQHLAPGTFRARGYGHEDDALVLVAGPDFRTVRRANGLTRSCAGPG